LLKFRRALVTGGAGFIGSHIVDRLIREGCEVVVIDDLSSGKVENLAESKDSGKLEFVRGDICDEESVRRAFTGVEVVFHAAAIVSVQRSISEPDLVNRVNVQGTSNLLRRAAEAGVERFVFSSSAAVYGRAVALPISEEAPLRPISPYGKSKREAEGLCFEVRSNQGLNVTVLRYFNVYGARSSAGEYSGVIRKFAERLYAKKPLVIYGNGKQVRDFVNVTDVVSVNILAATIQRGAGGVLNVGSGRCTTIAELAELETRLVLGPGKRARLQYRPARAGDIKKSCADISRMKKRLGFQPEVTLEQGLALYLGAGLRTSQD
jgi:nucleoside-diphosphate-sugar epimerase